MPIEKLYTCIPCIMILPIVDDFILSSTADDNKQLSCVLRYIDHQAAKLGVSFYQMLFILIQKDSNEKRKEKKRKKWLSKYNYSYAKQICTWTKDCKSHTDMDHYKYCSQVCYDCKSM